VNTGIKMNSFRPRWRKVGSDLWDDKSRTGLVIASIAVGVFAIGMIISGFVIMREDVNLSYASINPPNIDIQTDPFDKDFVEVIEKVPGVKDVEGRRIIGIQTKIKDGDWKNIKLVGVSDFSGDITHLTPIEGTQFPRDGEVIINQNMTHISGYHTGDSIEIELPDGSTHNLTVAGLVTDQTTTKPDPGATNNIYISLETLRSLGVEDFFNHLLVTVDGDGSDQKIISDVAEKIKIKTERSQREVYRQEEMLSSEHPMIDSILAILGVLGALGVLITILSSSLIVNTLNAILTHQLHQIGIMKLVGGRSYQILGMYLTLIIAYSLIALVLAVPLGAIAGYALAWFLSNFMGAAIQGFRIVPAAVTAQVLTAILIPLAAGFVPVRNGANIKVQLAISNYRPSSQKINRGAFNRNAHLFSWISRPVLLSIRNTFRKKGRLLLTIFTLTVAGAVFIGVFNVRDSMDNVMSQIMQHFLGDVTVNFSHPYRVSKVEQSLLGINGVTDVEAWGGAAGEIQDSNGNKVTDLSIVAPPSDTQLLDPDIVAGRWLLPEDEKALVVSDSIYKYYPDLIPGDKLILKIAGQRQQDWRVVGIFRFVEMLGDPIAYADFEYFADSLNLPNQASSYRLITEAHDAASQLALSVRINRYLSDTGFAIQSVQTGELLQKNASQGVNVLVIFLLIMAILTAIVGSIGLTGTMSINVFERTREIGIMRTIGAEDSVIMQSVVFEALVIGLITWILAIGLSFPISYALLNIIGLAMMGSAMTLSFTPLGILLWFIIVIILSVIASIMPARNAARLTINEVLAYE